MPAGLLVYFKKNKGEKNINSERFHKPDPDKKYFTPPKKLDAFPDAKPVKKMNPFAGGLRDRWLLPDGKILEWDRQQGEIEIYTEKENHLGAFCPNTGKQLKEPDITRNIKRYL